MHPIVAQMRASEEQIPAVLERGRDIVVTAGAGTGKTRTLVARYLSLLAEGHDLRSVLAITFTRKAARETRNRVRDEIRRYLQREDLDEREQQVWQDRYAALDAARIGIFPAEGDIPGMQDVLSEITPFLSISYRGQVKNGCREDSS